MRLQSEFQVAGTPCSKVAKMLLVECPKLTGQMNEAISNDDAPLLQRAAHTLKGSANIFAAKRVKEIAETDGVARGSKEHR